MSLDPKRKLWLWGLAIPVVAHVALLGFARGPKLTRKVFASTGLITLHAVIPWLDRYLGQDQSYIAPQDLNILQHDPYYTQVVSAYLPLQYSSNLLAAALVRQSRTQPSDILLLGSLLGLVNVVAMNVGHELGHKANAPQHLLAHLALLPSGYVHFRIEHNYGHHRHVATPQDPASAYYGESFWRFLPRTVLGGFKSAIHIEKNRLARKHLPFFHAENELLRAWAAGLLCYALMYKCFGKKWLLLQVVQSAYAITLLEAVNYMEHYALKRAVLPDGRYEKVTPQHSWNHNSLMSNLLFYQLQRHSDHHAYPTRPFQILRDYPDVPNLPKGYGALFTDVFLPKRWFKLMNQRVVAHYAGDLERIHQAKDHLEAV